ncbi:MAG: acyl-CoA dehydrogenase [Actinobacteria bacterium]|nr:MAG: acyl-CoA dehydrogenase [Actinomycetota bacterium]
MDFSWTEDQLEFRNSVLDFARNELNNDVRGRDSRSEFDAEGWKKCGAFGIQGLPYPTEYGGQGADVLTTVLAMEALGQGSRDNGFLFSLNAHMWAGTTPIARFGNEDQKQRWLPGLCDGSLISGQAITEPDTGSDAYALHTTVKKDGDSFVLNGTKTYATNAPIGDLMVVFASIDRSKGWAGLCAIVVEKGTPGMEVEAHYDKMGLRTSPMSGLSFNDCVVPAENLLGKVGSGMMIFNHSIEWERSCILASAIGTMERKLEECIDYANQREQFGQSIGKFQGVSHKIAEMKTRLETSRLLLYRTAWLRDQGKAKAIDASMVKYYISEALVQTCLDAVQIHGGSGYMTETEVERDVRDALSSKIYSGTSEIQLNVIARHLGL